MTIRLEPPYRSATPRAGRHNIREMDTIRQMEHVVASMVGRRLMYRELTA